MDTLGLTAPFVYPLVLNFTSSTGMVLNLANVNCLLVFQHTFDLFQGNKCFDLQNTLRILNQSFYEVNITANCTALTLYKFGASRLIFDKTTIEADGYYYFSYGSISATNSNTSSLTFATNPYFSGSYMLGLNSFALSGMTKIKFVSLTGTTTSISSNTGFDLLKFYYWSLKYRSCPTTNPYYYPTDGLCYDICPNGTYANTTSKMCLACSYTCLTCSSYSNCSSCNSSNFRTLNLFTCKPNNGYY